MFKKMYSGAVHDSSFIHYTKAAHTTAGQKSTAGGEIKGNYIMIS